MLLCQRGQDSLQCTTECEAIHHPTNLDIEDVEEEQEDDEEMEGDDAHALSMDDWEGALQVMDIDDEDGDEDEESRDRDLDEMDDPGQEYSISLSDQQKAAIDKLKEMLCSNSPASDSEILDSFANVTLQVFVSQPSDSVVNPYHTPIEAFLISRGLAKEGCFRSSMQMSSIFSKIQYIGLFTIMRECIKSGKEPLV